MCGYERRMHARMKLYGTCQGCVPPAADQGKHDQGTDERHDESKSEMLRDPQARAGCQCGISALLIDEMGQEDLFEEEEAGKNRGTDRQSARSRCGQMVFRRCRAQAMTIAPSLMDGVRNCMGASRRFQFSGNKTPILHVGI